MKGIRVALAGVVLAVATGCSSGGGDTAASNGSSNGSSNVQRLAGGSRAVRPAAAAAAGSASADIGLERAVVRTAELTVRTGDVGAAVTRAVGIVRSGRGYVAAQQANLDPADHGRDSANLVLKVPGAAYDGVFTSLQGLGTTLSRSQHADDVTGNVADVTSRLTTQRTSVARVRTLLARARTIGEVVSVESELTKREATLESLQARLHALKGQTNFATITMTLVTPATAPPPRRATATGFLAGLHAGWQALATVVRGGLTAVGALLPFGIALLLLGGVAIAALRLPRGRLLARGARREERAG